MRYIPNELKLATYWLAENKCDKKPTTTIGVLAKYYRDVEGLSKKEAKTKIVEHMQKTYAGFDIEDWNEKISQIVESIYKQQTKITSVEKIEVTESEMQVIMSFKSEKLQRVAFTMLVLLKIKHQVKGDTGSNWIEDRNKDIFKLANVRKLSTVEQGKMINQFVQEDCLRIGMKPGIVSRELKYVDYNSPTAITITDIDNFILDFDIYIGNKVVKCKECGMRFIAKSNNSKYCIDCGKKKKYEREVKSRSKNKEKS